MTVTEKGHFIFFDNYFSSVPLAKYLHANQEHLLYRHCAHELGRLALSPEEQEGAESATEEGRTSIQNCFFRGAVFYLEGQNAVPFINTICKPSNLTTAKRKKKDGPSITVTCPLSVQLYNSYMGGVDVADQLRKAYNSRRRSRKWWLPLFYFMVDISVVNSYILRRDSPHSAKHTLKEFILDLSTELMSSHSARKHSAHPSLDVPPSARFCERHFPS